MSGARRPLAALLIIVLRSAAPALAACASEPGGTAGSSTQAADLQASDTTTGTSTTTTSTTTTTAPTSGGDPPSAGTTAAACGAGGIDDCCCFEVSDGADQPILGIVCIAEDSPCAAPQARCPGAQTQCEAADLVVTSADGLECALDMLVSGEPGLLAWGVDASDGVHGSAHSLFVQADRTAFVSMYAYDDVDYTYGPVERRGLQPASFFDACLANSDSERFACLEQAVAGPATETCVDGFEGAIGH
jgi:hypothetical protein